MSATLYPTRVTVTGHPAQHGLCDLALTLDLNEVEDVRMILTTDQLIDLGEQITRKLGELPIRLVSNP